MMIRDQLLVNDYSQRLELKCFICSQVHASGKCNLVQYVPDRRRLVQRERRLINVRDGTFKRRSRRNRKKHIHIAFYINDPNFQIFEKIYGSEDSDKSESDLSDLEGHKIEEHIEFLTRFDI